MLSNLFDIIIIDSPPVELVSDALVIASQATGVIFVTKAMSTPYPLARKAIRRIRRANGNIIGVVLNALDFKKAEKYYGEYSVYGKYGSYRKSGYGGGYGQTYGTPAPATKPAAKA
jgi:Mrp family chromosome partitioning ATPase